MKWIVTGTLLDEEGRQILAFERGEIVVQTDEEDPQDTLAEVAQEMLDALDTAKVKLGKQIAATARNLRKSS